MSEICRLYKALPILNTCRTAVNAQSGVKTPAAGIVTGNNGRLCVTSLYDRVSDLCVCVCLGGIVLLALAALSSLFQYIPSASLAAIIIAAVIPVVDVRVVWTILKVNGWSCDHTTYTVCVAH